MEVDYSYPMRMEVAFSSYPMYMEVDYSYPMRMEVAFSSYPITWR